MSIIKTLEELGISPAPWRAHPYGVVTMNNGNNKAMIALVVGHRHLQADTRLMAAAPELYEALRELVDCIEMTNLNPYTEKANAVLAKVS